MFSNCLHHTISSKKPNTFTIWMNVLKPFFALLINSSGDNG